MKTLVTLPESYSRGRQFVRGSAKVIPQTQGYAVELTLANGTTHLAHEGLATEKRALFIARDYNRMGAPTEAYVVYERSGDVIGYWLRVEYGSPDHAFDTRVANYRIEGVEAHAILGTCPHGQFGDYCVHTNDLPAADWLREHPEAYLGLPEEDRRLVAELLTCLPTQRDRLYA